MIGRKPCASGMKSRAPQRTCTQTNASTKGHRSRILGRGAGVTIVRGAAVAIVLRRTAAAGARPSRTAPRLSSSWASRSSVFISPNAGNQRAEERLVGVDCAFEVVIAAARRGLTLEPPPLHLVLEHRQQRWRE